ncbi:MAG: DUF4337 domain-containing protein [Acidobacteria bacterium]|nr:DUF4337 domain-containing protein [Acidobacteriota bacterium]
MAEAVEIPEAKDPFERQVALTIAVLAVVLSVVSTVGDNAKGEALLAATKASNQWAYYQAKSIKEHSYDLAGELLGAVGSSLDPAAREALAKKYGDEVARYEREKNEIRAKAEEQEKEIVRNGLVNDRCDLAGVLLQVAIVVGSIAILVRWKALWGASAVLGVAGVVTFATVFLMK